MTTEEIDALDGPALGLAVAEHVMGWERTIKVPKRYPSYYESFDFDHSSRIMLRRHDIGLSEIWRPWVSMGDAWEVVERMMDLGYHFDLGDLHEHPGQEPKFECSFQIDCGDRWDHEFYHNDSMPIAICRAALRAKFAKGGGL